VWKDELNASYNDLKFNRIVNSLLPKNVENLMHERRCSTMTVIVVVVVVVVATTGGRFCI
jgi:hypothetical protein